MRSPKWVLAAALAWTPIANAQTQVQLPDKAGQVRMPVQPPGTTGAPVSADLQDVPLMTHAVNSILLEWHPVDGLPFAATGDILAEHTLDDGSVVRHSCEVAVWRDTEGRLRADSVFTLAGFATLHMVTVVDPNNRTTMVWSIGNYDTTVLLKHLKEPGANESTRLSRDQVAPVLPAPEPGVQSQPQTGTDTAVALPLQDVTLPSAGIPRSQAVRTEYLPADTIAGLYVTDVRYTKIIPAGTAGNERDITLISENWTSPDLKITVRQITDDPRSGKVTTELTNVDRTDPDPALFQPPEGYTVRDMSLPAPAPPPTPH